MAFENTVLRVWAGDEGILFFFCLFLLLLLLCNDRGLLMILNFSVCDRDDIVVLSNQEGY